jgi:outer membrane protein OmpA-like peptidoglycan-associated protein
MSEDRNDEQKYAFIVVTGVVGLVVAGVLAWAFSGPLKHSGKAVKASTATASVTKSAAATASSTVKVEPISIQAAPVVTTAEAASAVDHSAPQGNAAQSNTAEPEGRVYFDVGSEALPAESLEVLIKVADKARIEADKTVLISGYHDASGDPAQNADLAKRRAQAVRHALEANGVAPARLVMAKPLMSTGGTDPREARRVELRLR